MTKLLDDLISFPFNLLFNYISKVDNLKKKTGWLRIFFFLLQRDWILLRKSKSQREIYRECVWSSSWRYWLVWQTNIDSAGCRHFGKEDVRLRRPPPMGHGNSTRARTAGHHHRRRNQLVVAERVGRPSSSSQSERKRIGKRHSSSAKPDT